ncbi:MAG: F-type H+-transporting ATPase subunit AtpI [Idiomarinaceae bacterium HL-53]|nr:MAG: F-type H+-transporting ATPase subunit AtpI [Idiomarinaceae bacterium HL-53]CUS47828.1 ATP synthase protein I [Idiomarinaceae bacterium HL-53]
MTNKQFSPLTSGGRRIAVHVLKVQLVAALVLIAIMYLIYGVSGVLTAAAGACIGLIPNIVFARYAFRYGGARSASNVVQSFYAGEALKMVLTVVLFTISFVILNGPWLPLFAVFITVTVLQWLAPFLNLKIN